MEMDFFLFKYKMGELEHNSKVKPNGNSFEKPSGFSRAPAYELNTGLGTRE